MPERNEWRGGDREADRVVVERLTVRLEEIKSRIADSQNIITNIIEPVSRLSSRYDHLKEFTDRELERAAKQRDRIEADIENLGREVKDQIKSTAEKLGALSDEFISLKSKIAVWGTIGAVLISFFSGLIVKYLPK